MSDGDRRGVILLLLGIGMMDDVACAIALGTRSLAMEVLCCLPPAPKAGWLNGAKICARGASIVDMQKDFVVGKSELSAVLNDLATRWAIEIARVAPCRGMRGARVAFVERQDWASVQDVCESYLATCGEATEDDRGVPG